MNRQERDHLALYIWDYFYLTHRPLPVDQAPWVRIEQATNRIRESQIYVDHPPTPVDVRLRHAKRVRNAARAALRAIAQLSVTPDAWTVDGLVAIEHSMELLAADLRDQARDLVVD